MTERLRGPVAQSGTGVGVDRAQNVIRGYVVAQLGPFKTPGRGQFSELSLQEIVRLGNETGQGIKSRFTHPNLSNDGLGTYLGRAKNFFLDGDKVRADLHFDKTAKRTPRHGNLQEYVMGLAESDPDALSSSLVLSADKKYLRNDDGTLMEDEDGNPLPPVWHPTRLLASDVVDTGDAVDGFLSLPDDGPRFATELIDQLFDGDDRQSVEAKCLSFLERYLANRFGVSDMTESQIDNELLAKVDEQGKKIDQLAEMIQQEREAREKAEKQLAESKARAAEISSLCTIARKPELAAKYISDETLSADDVRSKLLAGVEQDTQLSGDNDDSADQRKDEKLNAKYREEYREHLKIHKALGVSEEDYISERRIEDGLDEAE